MTKLKNAPDFYDHILGNLNAPIVLVEYGDYECPHTKKSHLWIKNLLKEFSQDICYIYRHFPLTKIHPHAEFASLAAESAAQYNHFWEMHDALFETVKNLSEKEIEKEASHLGISEDSFFKGINKSESINHIMKDILSGEDNGILSTPVFFVNGTKLEGPISYEILRGHILNAIHGRNLTL